LGRTQTEFDAIIHVYVLVAACHRKFDRSRSLLAGSVIVCLVETRTGDQTR
jgi:hypothetical protein